MSYTAENAKRLYIDSLKALDDLLNLMVQGLGQSEQIENKKVRDHLRHGAGRRLGTLRRSLQMIFKLFPPSQKTPLPHDTLTDVQVYLQAFLLNLSGVFDNWAWAFLFRHGLQDELDKRDVGLFLTRTQAFLPAGVRDYLVSSEIAAWQRDYLKEYRDALTHRIPVYIPPSAWKPEDQDRYNRLEREKRECIQKQDWEQLDKAWAEQDGIGQPVFLFMHEFSDDKAARPLVLHPQLLCDSATVVACGKKFYESWHECVRPTPRDGAAKRSP